MLLGPSVVRKPGAIVFLPTEDEWYKAAYHKNDGVTANYFDYPTSSDAIPGYVNESGNLSSTGTPFIDGVTDPGNYATYGGDGGTNGIGSPYYLTAVGEWENSDSPFGTFEQGGNVWEGNEALIGGSSSVRGLRGGSRSGASARDLYLRASSRYLDGYPEVEYTDVGFRVATIPEPLILGDMNDDGHLNGLDVNGFVNAVLYDSFNPYADMVGNDEPDGLDVDPFVAAVVGGGAQNIPESSTLLLCITALTVVGGWRKRGG